MYPAPISTLRSTSSPVYVLCALPSKTDALHDSPDVLQEAAQNSAEQCRRISLPSNCGGRGFSFSHVCTKLVHYSLISKILLSKNDCVVVFFQAEAAYQGVFSSSPQTTAQEAHNTMFIGLKSLLHSAQHSDQRETTPTVLTPPIRPTDSSSSIWTGLNKLLHSPPSIQREATPDI